MLLEFFVGLLAVAWVATVVFMLRYVRSQRLLQAQHAEAAAQRDLRLRELLRRLEHYQAGTVHMGDQLQELQSIVGPLPNKVSALELRDPSTLSFAQAARLVGMGASVDELTQSCGLTQAEAQLISKLHRGE